MRRALAGRGNSAERELAEASEIIECASWPSTGCDFPWLIRRATFNHRRGQTTAVEADLQAGELPKSCRALTP